MKKYIKFIVLFIVIVLIGIFIFKKYYSSFDVKPQLKYTELENYLLENSDFLIYVTNDKNVKEVKNYFENKNIEILYMYLDKNDSKDFGNKYGINNLPKIIYFKDGSIKEYIVYDKDIVEEFLSRNGFLE